ncbi:MAG: anthranilate phosphoribosyltransferase [Acidobacteriaceae bacterium]|nr:anthranilate phosphoribosyltransferase [Acidobacteriaceae bacterium]
MSQLPFRNSVHLTQAEAYDLMHKMLSGEMDTEGIADLLGFLRRKGETVAELVGFARAIRDMSEPIALDQSEDPLLDTCGTGGDCANTFNISTATAFVAAGAGVRVAKHGNRRISSECGSADVLEALGIPCHLTARQAIDCIQGTGIGFLYAPLLHPAVKHAQEARIQLKGRTVFNMLGPLTNPVGARVQLIGAFSVRAAEMLALAAARLGIDRAFVMHGADGLDEITTTGPTTVFQVEEGRVQKGRWLPSDFGVAQASIEDLRGGDLHANAAIIRELLDGKPGAPRDIVIANAAAAILAAQHAPDLKTAVPMAIQSIDSGAARDKLRQVIEFVGTLKADHEVV